MKDQEKALRDTFMKDLGPEGQGLTDLTPPQIEIEDIEGDLPLMVRKRSKSADTNAIDLLKKKFEEADGKMKAGKFQLNK